MKFRCVDEMDQLSFDDAGVLELKKQENQIEWKLEGAVVKDRNSQNSRFQDCYCGEILLCFQDAKIERIVKEGLKYFDANGKLTREVPDEDILEDREQEILIRCRKGKVFTIVTDDVEDGYAYELGIDVPQEEDDEEIDTFWLCIRCKRVMASWDKYCGPVNG